MRSGDGTCIGLCIRSFQNNCPWATAQWNSWPCCLQMWDNAIRHWGRRKTTSARCFGGCRLQTCFQHLGLRLLELVWKCFQIKSHRFPWCWCMPCGRNGEASVDPNPGSTEAEGLASPAGPPAVTQQAKTQHRVQHATHGNGHLTPVKTCLQEKNTSWMINDKCHVPGRNVMMNWFDGVSKSTQSYSMHASAIRTPIDTRTRTTLSCIVVPMASDGFGLAPKRLRLYHLCTLNWRAYVAAGSLRHVRPGLLSAWVGSTFECHRSKQCQHKSNPCDHHGCLPRYLYQRLRIWVWGVVLPVQAVNEDHQRFKT